MLKIIYTADRLSGVTREQFVRRWRAHGSLAMSLDGFFEPVQRYVHADTVVDAERFPGTDDYDGVGELYYRSPEDCRHSLGSEDLTQRIVRDGDDVFDRRRAINIAVEPIARVGAREGLLKLFVFWTAGTANTTRWAPPANPPPRADLACCMAHWRPIDVGKNPSPIVGLSEWWFDTLADAAAFHAAWRSGLEPPAQARVRPYSTAIGWPRTLYDIEAYA